MTLKLSNMYSVNPIYYVTFTTATLIASFVLFKGFNTNDAVNTISLLCGFLIIFTGVYLLNLSRGDPHGLGDAAVSGRAPFDDGIPTDGLSGLQSRRSMQMRRSETFSRASVSRRRDSAVQRLLRDEESAVGLRNLTEEDDAGTESENEMGDPQRSPLVGVSATRGR
jgi:hypothetical protein